MPSKNRLRVVGGFVVGHRPTSEREWLNNSFSVLKLGLYETQFLYF